MHLISLRTLFKNSFDTDSNSFIPYSWMAKWWKYQRQWPWPI